MTSKTADGRGISLPRLLRTIYVGRMAVASSILLGAFATWGVAHPGQTLVATVSFLMAAAFTALSYGRSHMNMPAVGEAAREPGRIFLHAQSLFDAVLVTAIVHVTGGAESAFTPLYILVIGVSALLLPPLGVGLVWIASSALFIADVLLAHPATAARSADVIVGLFAVVAVVTGWLGWRLRAAGQTLGAVESELRQLRFDTGDILANLSTGLLTVDGLGRLVYANHAAETLLDLDLESLRGRAVLDRIDGAFPAFGSVLRRSVERRAPVSRHRAPAVREGVDIVLGLSTAVNERPDAGPATITAIFQDITDADRIEALNLRNERLEAVAELSASLAHEIKNPLASIRSSVEQLGKNHLEAGDRALLEGLVLSESDRLSRLLSEFIEFARIRGGSLGPVDLAEVVRAAVAVAREHPDTPDTVRIQVLGTDEPLPVRGDADLLHRAVFNLVLNAVQHSGEGDTVAVEVSRTEADADARAAGIERPLRIRVSDAGPGVPPTDAARIFDPFFTTRQGGSGLGLSVVHRAVEAHGGTVFVERSGGGGARFVMFIPCERVASAEPVRAGVET